MPELVKVWLARYFERENKHPFATAKVVASNFHEAEFKAQEWGEQKYNSRMVKCVIEKSKTGEVVV